MYTYLTEHTRREGQMLEEYAAAAEGTQSKALSYLVNLLLEDEHRHHRLFNDLAASLKTEAELSGAEPVIPRLDFRSADRTELVAVAKKLLDNERADAKELKRLRKEMHQLEDTTLWAVLVDLMLRDTEKHIALLRFVVDHAKSKHSF